MMDRVLVITGAGVSAESGIPTFRGKGGYWRNRQSGSDFDPMKLATPEGFAENPERVWEWYRARRKQIREAQPNPAHRAIARLSIQAREFLLVTQNVDDLHARGGVPVEKMVQIHGNIFVTRCPGCGLSDPGRGSSSDRNFEQEQEEEEEMIPRCPECGGLMRPGVVWFGEQLDRRKIDIVEDFIASGPCDMVIVAGTTAAFGYIIDWAVRASTGEGELIEINLEETPLSRFATRLVRESAASSLPRIVEALACGDVSSL